MSAILNRPNISEHRLKIAPPSLRYQRSQNQSRPSFEAGVYLPESLKPVSGTSKAMSALYNLIQGEADVADESDDESFDEETGEVRRKANGTNGINGHLDDSSEEEDDDDEEAARAVCASIKVCLA